ncbi:MAG: DUF3604 domain-containing protein [Kiritimatiellia bacterium]
MKVHARISKNSFEVRQPCTVRLAVTCDEPLRAGDSIECQFPNSWTVLTGPSFTRTLQTTDPSRDHLVTVLAPGTDAVFATEIRPRHLNWTEAKARHGRLITATLTTGCVPSGTPIFVAYDNTFAPYIAERETVWIRVKNHAPLRSPVLRVKGGPHKTLRILAPSGAEPEQPFDVLIVSLDQFDNPAKTRFAGEKLCLTDGTVVAENLDFRGTARVRVRIEKCGVYRFVLRDTISNAVRVETGRIGPYWGDLHIHTKLSSDGQGTDPYTYARNVSGLDFAATTDHSESLGPEGYRITEQWLEEANEPGRFVTVPGDERNPEALTGHHNIYFRDIELFRFHQAVPGGVLLDDPSEEAAYLSRLPPERVMLVPHHTGINWRTLAPVAPGGAMDWEAWQDPGLRPVMEIYSHHGQSELYCPQHILSYELNRMRNPERRTNVSRPGPYYAQQYWTAGKRIGVICSSDEHSGQGGRRHGGIAAVFAPELTREAIFDAIRKRSCYGTTGERILVEFSINEVPMGGVLRQRQDHPLTIHLRVWGTARILRVEILRYRFGTDSAFLPVLTDAPRPESLEAAYKLEDEFRGPCMYYARVMQEPLEWPGMAWTSPVWVDEC